MFLVPVGRSPVAFHGGIDRLFDETLDRLLQPVATGDAGVQAPALDVIETERSYTVQMDLPGVAKDAVKIAIEGRRVSIEAPVAPPPERRDGERVLHRERRLGGHARSFTLPSDIDQAESQARLELGVLTLTLAKRRVHGASHLTVN